MYDKAEIDPRDLIRELGTAEERIQTAKEWGFFSMYDDEAKTGLPQQNVSSQKRRRSQPKCSGCGRFL